MLEITNLALTKVFFTLVLVVFLCGPRSKLLQAMDNWQLLSVTVHSCRVTRQTELQGNYF